MFKKSGVLALCFLFGFNPLFAQTKVKTKPREVKPHDITTRKAKEPLKKCTAAYIAKWVNAHPNEAGKAPVPKPTPAPITACIVSPVKIKEWKEDLLNRKFKRIKTLPLYTREGAARLQYVYNIVRPIEKKYDLEPGFLIYLAWLESGFNKEAHPPDDLSSADSWYQWLLGSGKDAGLLDGIKEAPASGWICANPNQKKCTRYIQATCLKKVAVNDRRDNLALAAEATAKNLKATHDKWGPTFGWWWHHNPSSRGKINEPLIEQLKLGRHSSIQEPKTLLASYGIKDAIDLAGAAVLCGGRASQVGKDLTDGSLTYPASVLAGIEVLRIYQPSLVGQIENEKAEWHRRKSTNK